MRCSIEKITAREILDSRGNPTVEATVRLTGGSTGTASVPSGASTGKYEAVELRDGTGSVRPAVERINGEIDAALRGRCACDQTAVDALLCRLDGTENKSRLGGNATLAVSAAAARAAAQCHGLPLWRYLGGVDANVLPRPMMNILNGGRHASNNVDVQEFMIVPTGAETFPEALAACRAVFGALRDALRARGLSTGVGDEGGFAPDLSSDEQALELLTEAVERAGLRPGRDVSFALDAAASEWADGDGYRLPKQGRRFTAAELSAWFETLCGRYPIVSIEDPFGEDDWDAWTGLTARLGSRAALVGDDLFVTNERRLREGLRRGAANSVLIKPNQIGTLSETFRTIRLAQQNGCGTILSHRSGETSDALIADLAVAARSARIKAGAPCRGERVAKYNRLLRIAQTSGARLAD